MSEQEEALKRAATRYRKAVDRANDIKAKASEELAAEIRAAYDGGKGMKKSDIIRATGYVWSRTWVDNALRANKAQSADQQ